jgi:hypothetical protein
MSKLDYNTTHVKADTGETVTFWDSHQGRMRTLRKWSHKRVDFRDHARRANCAAALACTSKLRAAR